MRLVYDAARRVLVVCVMWAVACVPNTPMSVTHRWKRRGCNDPVQSVCVDIHRTTLCMCPFTGRVTASDTRRFRSWTAWCLTIACFRGLACFRRCMECGVRSLQAAQERSTREMNESPISYGVAVLYEYKLKLRCPCDEGGVPSGGVRWLDTRLISRMSRPPTHLRPRPHTSLLLSAMVGDSVSDDLADGLNARLHSFDVPSSNKACQALRVDEVMAVMAGRIMSDDAVLVCTDEYLNEYRLCPADTLPWGKTV